MSDDNKYKNGKIYTIRNRNDNSLIYVGSTVQPLYKRFSKHKSDAKRPLKEDILLYKKFKETDINDWYIELYEDCPCDRKEQLTQREGQVIREIGTLNKEIAGRTRKEWRKDNKDHIQEQKKEYYQANKNHILEKQKEYKSEHVFCVCGCSVVRNNLARHKESPKHEKIMKELAKTQEILGEHSNTRM
jgi:hypothetical protein